MYDQQPSLHPAQIPGAAMMYGPPPAREVSAAYRRWARVLVGLSIVIGVLLAVALVASFVLLARADAKEENAAYGYLALFLWFGIVAAIPVLLAVALPGAVMARRVRRVREQEAWLATHAPARAEGWPPVPPGALGQVPAPVESPWQRP